MEQFLRKTRRVDERILEQLKIIEGSLKAFYVGPHSLSTTLNTC